MSRWWEISRSDCRAIVLSSLLPIVPQFLETFDEVTETAARGNPQVMPLMNYYTAMSWLVGRALSPRAEIWHWAS